MTAYVILLEGSLGAMLGRGAPPAAGRQQANPGHRESVAFEILQGSTTTVDPVWEASPVRESLPVGAPGRARLGCVFALAMFLVGGVFASAQGWVLLHTWAYCQNVDPAIATDQYPDGGAYIWAFPWAIRLLLYSTLFGVTGAVIRGRFARGIPLALV